MNLWFPVKTTKTDCLVPSENEKSMLLNSREVIILSRQHLEYYFFLIEQILKIQYIEKGSMSKVSVS